LCARFCNNGSVIPLIPDAALGLTAPDGTTKLTCGNIQDFIQRSPVDSNSGFCYQIEYAGIKNCGCPEKTITELGFEPCNLRETEGDLFNPNTQCLFDDLSTCFDDAASAYSSPSNDTICLLVQATAGEYCGCSNPVARAKFNMDCPLCGAGALLPDPKRIWSNNLTCAFAEYYAASTKSCYGLQEDQFEGTGTTFLNEAAKVCCPPSSALTPTPNPTTLNIPLLSSMHPPSSRPGTTVKHGKMMGMAKGTGGMMGGRGRGNKMPLHRHLNGVE
jgi:hypothetical protein